MINAFKDFAIPYNVTFKVHYNWLMMFYKAPSFINIIMITSLLRILPTRSLINVVLGSRVRFRPKKRETADEISEVGEE